MNRFKKAWSNLMVKLIDRLDNRYLDISERHSYMSDLIETLQGENDELQTQINALEDENHYLRYERR